MLFSAIKNFKSEASGKVAPFLTREVLASALLVIAVLSGRLSFAPHTTHLELPDFWFELRLWITLATLLLSLPLITDVQRHLTPVLVCIGALLAYLVLRSLTLPGSGEQIRDTMYLAIQLTCLTLLASKQECLKAIGCLTLLAAVGLFILASVGIKNEVLNGAGWAPLGGPITFYRIEFLGLCISLYCFLRQPRIIYFLLAATFVFAVWASLSKIAPIASLTALIPIFIIGLRRREFGKISLIFMALLLGYLVWQGQYSSIMKLRFAQTVNTGSTVASEAAVSGSSSTTRASRAETATVASEAADSGRVDSTSLHPGQDLSIRAEYCTLLDNGTPTCHVSLLVDRSARLLMYAVALKGFFASPVLGNGMGQYRVRSVNIRTGLEEVYLYPHNIIAEMLYSGGVIALFLLFSIMVFSVRIYARAAKGALRNSAIIATGIFIFVSALVSGDLYDLRLFLCISIILSALSREPMDARN